MWWMTWRAQVQCVVDEVASTGTLCGLTRAIAVIVKHVVHRHRLVPLQLHMLLLLLLLLGSS